MSCVLNGDNLVFGFVFDFMALMEDCKAIFQIARNDSSKGRLLRRFTPPKGQARKDIFRRGFGCCS
jgi:hypothetical protein